MTNLIEETRSVLKHIGKNAVNISWVGSYDGKYAMSWFDFRNKFKDINYYAGYGAQKIASDLVIVFGDHSWLERKEYDGSEHWTYKRVPVFKGFNNFDIVDAPSVGLTGWKDLDGLNGGGILENEYK